MAPPPPDQRIDVVTLRVEDLDRAHRYHVEGLGWEPLLSVPGEVTFFQVGHSRVLSLFAAEDFDAEADGVPAPPLTLGQNVADEDEVRATVQRMVAAGATVVQPPARAPWGGYRALVRDPSGFLWEVVHNPGLTIAADGTVTLTEVEG